MTRPVVPAFLLVLLGISSTQCIGEPSLESGTGAVISPSAELLETATEAVQASYGPTVTLRLFELNAPCDPNAPSYSPDCLADEVGGTADIPFVTRSWQEFEQSLANPGQNPGQAYGAVLAMGGVLALADTPVPGPGDVAGLGVVVIGGLVVTVMVGQAIANDPAIRGRVDAMLQSVQTEVATALQSLLAAVAGKWLCDASCNLDGPWGNTWCSGARVTGSEYCDHTLAPTMPSSSQWRSKPSSTNPWPCARRILRFRRCWLTSSTSIQTQRGHGGPSTDSTKRTTSARKVARGASTPW